MMAVEELINSMFLEMPTLKLSEFQVKLWKDLYENYFDLKC